MVNLITITVLKPVGFCLWFQFTMYAFMLSSCWRCGQLTSIRFQLLCALLASLGSARLDVAPCTFRYDQFTQVVWIIFHTKMTFKNSAHHFCTYSASNDSILNWLVSFCCWCCCCCRILNRFNFNEKKSMQNALYIYFLKGTHSTQTTAITFNISLSFMLIASFARSHTAKQLGLCQCSIDSWTRLVGRAGKTTN